MQNNQKASLSLRVKPQNSVRVNKPLVIIVLVILVVISALLIVNAFKTSKPINKNKTQEIASQNLQPIISEAIEKLPQDYSDTQTIKKYLGQTDSKTTIPPEVQQELLTLKNQQEFLEQRLSDMSSQQHAKEQQQNDVQVTQAKTSGLFFPGGAPKTDIDEKLKTSATAQTTSSPSSDDSFSIDKQSTYAQQNMQVQKIQFLKTEDKPEDIYNMYSLVKPISPYEIQAGTLIPSVLITGINTSLPGNVVAQVREDVFDTVTGKFLLIPKGSKLLGEYDSQISYGQERILIAFNRIIRPDGSSIQLAKSGGTDLLGQSGMEGSINNHWGKVLGAAALSTLLSVGAGAASDKISRGNYYYPSSGQGALLGASSSISQTGQQVTDRAINVQPTLSISPGYEFDVIVRKDVVLEPFRKSNGPVVLGFK